MRKARLLPQPTFFESNAVAWVIVFLYTLLFAAPMLRCFFSIDDLFNLNYYTSHPFWQALTANLFFWTSYYRPLGGVIYLCLYRVFGMQAFPYYLFGFLIYNANVALLFFLLFRLTRSGFVATLATAMAAVHREFTDIWFNFGALYELLAFGFMLGAIHLYLSLLENENRRRCYYLLSLLAFVIALNAKETAVVTPIILALYHFVYRSSPQKFLLSAAKPAIRLIPFFLLALIYTTGKVLGKEALWRENFPYRYQFDFTFYGNLQAYFEKLFYLQIHFDAKLLAWTLMLSLALAFLLRNRHMLFGWLYFLTCLLPVIALPRVWGLFLYIPLAGAALYVAALLAQLGKSVRQEPIAPVVSAKLLTAAKLLTTIFLLCALMSFHFRDIHAAANRALARGAEWRRFIWQLSAIYPELPRQVTLVFENPPIEGLMLNLLVQLQYQNPQMRALRSIDDLKVLLAARANISELHLFQYNDGTLREINPADLFPASPSAASLFTGGSEIAGNSDLVQHFLIPVKRTASGGIKSGLVVHNPGPSPARMEISLYDLEGAAVPEGSISMSLPGGEYLLRYADEIFTRRLQNISKFQGTLRVDSSEPVHAKTIWFNQQSVATLPVNAAALNLASPLAPANHSACLTQFSNGGGNSSTLILINPHSIHSARGSMEVLDPQGRPAAVEIDGQGRRQSFKIDIPPRGIHFFSTAGPATLFSGWVSVSTDTPLEGMVLFEGRRVGLAAIGSSPPGKEFLIPVESDTQRGISTTVAVSNPTQSETSLLLTLHDENSQPTEQGRITVTIAANGQLARFVSEIFAKQSIDFSKFRGWLKIQSSESINVSALRLTPVISCELTVHGFQGR